jgi:hypothetical protein
LSFFSPGLPTKPLYEPPLCPTSTTCPHSTCTYNLILLRLRLRKHTKEDANAHTWYRWCSSNKTRSSLNEA